MAHGVERAAGQPLPQFAQHHFGGPTRARADVSALCGEVAGLPLVPLHHLRRGSASLQLSARVEIAIVSKRMGHSKIDLTSDTYGHLIGKGGEASRRGRRGARATAYPTQIRVASKIPYKPRREPGICPEGNFALIAEHAG
jgi:integrase